MTEQRARQLFDRTVNKLSDAGWDVVAVIRHKGPDGEQTSTRIVTQEEDRVKSASDVLLLTEPIRREALRIFMEGTPPTSEPIGVSLFPQQLPKMTQLVHPPGTTLVEASHG
jgi:hypothetical protein